MQPMRGASQRARFLGPQLRQPKSRQAGASTQPTRDLLLSCNSGVVEFGQGGLVTAAARTARLEGPRSSGPILFGPGSRRGVRDQRISNRLRPMADLRHLLLYRIYVVKRPSVG